MIKLLIALIIFSPTLLLASGAEITVPSVVEVSPRSSISLFDIVEAKNMTDEIASELINVRLPSKSVLSKSEIIKIVRTVNARFILPSELKVIKSQSAVSRMEVERKIKNKIFSQCAECEVSVQVSSVPARMEADWALDLNLDLTKNSLMIPIFSQGNSDAKAWVVAQVRRYQLVPVLNRSVRVGEVLTEDMLSYEKRQLLNQRDTVLKSEAVVGMQAARFLSAGQLIQNSDLKREQVLKRGQIVKAIFGNESFEVAITAEVQESAAVGDVVKVKNLDSQKVFAGKVIDRGLVRIE